MKVKLPGVFLLLHGNHIEAVPDIENYPEGDTPAGRNEAGTKMIKRTKYRQGSQIVSERDLCALFNGVGNRKQKFQYLRPAPKGATSKQAPPQDVNQELEDEAENELLTMSVAELKAYAEENEIDLMGARLKSDILERIQEHQNNPFDEGEAEEGDE